MIDGFKFKITDKRAIELILGNEKLCFQSHINLCDATIDIFKQTAFYKSLRFEYIQSRSIVYIRGNLYEYYTGLRIIKTMGLMKHFLLFSNLP
jgi:hypothetical protein